MSFLCFKGQGCNSKSGLPATIGTLLPLGQN